MNAPLKIPHGVGALPSSLWRGVGGEGQGREADGEAISGAALLDEPSPLASLQRDRGNSASRSRGRVDPGVRSPRVLHVVRQFLPNRGGLEDVVFQLCREQQTRGIDVRVMTLDRLFRDPATSLAPRETLAGLDIHRIPFRGSHRYPLALGFMPHLGWADLVHVHAIDFFFDALALTKPLHRKPLVATTHGGFFHTQAFSGLKSLWFQGPTRLSSKVYDAVVGCSTTDAATFRRIAGDSVRTVENGVDLAKFAGASSPVPVKRLVTLGRFSTNKRPERLIALMRALGPDWHLDLIGVESDWTAERLRTAIAEAGVGGNVSLHVGIADREIAEILRGASLFVSASEFEGFGLALIEAMSAGLVPLVQPNPAFAALAAKQPTVRLTDFADPAAAAVAVREAFDDLQRGRGQPEITSLSAYAWPAVAQAYVDVYAESCPSFRTDPS